MNGRRKIGVRERAQQQLLCNRPHPQNSGRKEHTVDHIREDQEETKQSARHAVWAVVGARRWWNKNNGWVVTGTGTGLGSLSAGLRYSAAAPICHIVWGVVPFPHSPLFTALSPTLSHQKPLPAKALRVQIHTANSPKQVCAPTIQFCLLPNMRIITHFSKVAMPNWFARDAFSTVDSMHSCLLQTCDSPQLTSSSRQLSSHRSILPHQDTAA